MNILWLVGIHIAHIHFTKANESTNAFDIIGVYDSEEKAVAACKTINHFCGPIILNETLPDESQEWVGSYYPMAKKEEK